MGEPIRKLVVSQKKVPKSILVVTNAEKMRRNMGEIRALGYECASIEPGSGSMHILQAKNRINLVVLDLQSARTAERMIWWIKTNRPGVHVVCILTDADLAEFGPRAITLGAVVLKEDDIEKIPEVLRSILEPNAPC